MAVRYVERPEVVVVGQASGTEYRFSPAHPVQAVDARDAEALLRTRYFILAS